MNLGVVIKIKKKKTIIVTETGEFKAINTRDGMFLGQKIIFSQQDVIEDNKKSSGLMYSAVVAGVVAVFVFMFTYFSLLNFEATFAYIDVDVNPSVEFAVNRDGIIIGAEPLNEDGKKILEELTYKDTLLEDAILDLIDKSRKYGFITEDDKKNIVLISAVLYSEEPKEKNDFEDKLVYNLMSDFKSLDVNIEMRFVFASKEQRKKALENKVSVGKYMIYERAKQEGKDVTLEAIVSEPLEDLLLDQNFGLVIETDKLLPVETATASIEPVSTPSVSAVATATKAVAATMTPTETSAKPAATPTKASVTVAPTDMPAQSTVTPEKTPVKPTATSTKAPIKYTATPTKVPVKATATPTPTKTPVKATATPTPAKTPVKVTATPTPAKTPVKVTATPTPAKTPVKATATPTPTKIPVKPIDTPMNTPGQEQSVKVRFYNNNTLSETGVIYVRLNIINTGNTSLNLSDLKLRYYYTIDSDSEQRFNCDWSSIGAHNVTGRFVKMNSPQTGADTYVEIGFVKGAGELQPGESVELNARFSKTDNTQYNKADDYSFNSHYYEYMDWDKITAYISGILKWGREP
ncbi:anti-sigma-I factor RsgI family protein [Acetivibrio straminisolvens]|jgi:hypothetical protein|nr:cellulose binding domain-containing protein [Acetivibrio straminisolvens]